MGLIRRSFVKLLGGSAVAVALSRDGSSLAQSAASCTHAQKVCNGNRCRQSCVTLCADPANATCPACAGSCPPPDPDPEPEFDCSKADAACDFDCESGGCVKFCRGEAGEVCAGCLACVV